MYMYFLLKFCCMSASLQVSLDKMALIEEFGKYFNPSSMKGTYRKATIAVVKVSKNSYCSVQILFNPMLLLGANTYGQ